MRYCEKHGVRMETPDDACKFCAGVAVGNPCRHGLPERDCDICERDELIEQLKADAVNARNQSAVFDDIAERLAWVSTEIDRARDTELVTLRSAISAVGALRDEILTCSVRSGMGSELPHDLRMPPAQAKAVARRIDDILFAVAPGRNSEPTPTADVGGDTLMDDDVIIGWVQTDGTFHEWNPTRVYVSAGRLVDSDNCGFGRSTTYRVLLPRPNAKADGP